MTAAERELIQCSQVGGIILFARNYRDVSQLQELVADIRQLRPDILLAVDQEGGRVQRFKQDFTRLPPMNVFRARYQQDPRNALRLATDCGWLMAVELLSVGIDISFAPVLDVDDHFCSVIADRSFSSDPQEVIALAGAFMAGMHEAGMATTGKHFPGHGAVREDSHEALPIDTRSMEQVRASDMLPFVQLQQQLDALMPAHILFDQIDTMPVGFSKFWLQEVVRQELGFDGVIFSDDLTMSATESYGDYQQRAYLALAADCDMVLVCNNPEGATTVLSTLENAQQPLSTRLAKLRARRHWDRNAVQQSERWLTTKNELQELVAACG